MTVHLENRWPEADFFQSTLHDLECCHLLRDEQNPLPISQEQRDEIGDSLALTRSGRAIDHEVLAVASAEKCL